MGTLRLHPFVDVPNHLAAATIIRHAGEPGNVLADFYAVPTLFKPNAFHLAFCWLPIFRSAEAANAAFFCLYVLLVPLLTFLVIRDLDGEPWLALLSFLPLYNFNVCWGLVGFVASVPLTLLLFRILSRHLEGPTTGSAIAVVGTLVLFFFVHAQATLFAALLLVTMTAVRLRGSLLRGVRHLLLTLPALTIFALWWVRDWASTEPSGDPMGTFVALRDYYLHEYLASLPRRSSPLFLADNTFLGTSAPYVAAGAAFFLVLGGFAATGVVRWIRSSDLGNGRRRLEAPLVLLGCSTACYFLLPENLPGHQFVSQRFSVVVLLALVILAGALARGPARRLAVGTAVAAACLHAALWTSYFLSFQGENAGFDRRLLPDASRGPMAGLIYERYFRDRPVYIHFQNYQIVWNRGIATTKLVDFRFGLIRRRVPETVLPVYRDWPGPEDPYRGWYSDLPSILVRGAVPPEDARYLREYRVAARRGAWSLYEKPASPAAPLPNDEGRRSPAGPP